MARPVRFSTRSWYSALAAAVGTAFGAARTPLTYRLFTGSLPLDPRLGKVVQQFYDVSIPVGFRRDVTLNEVGASNNRIQLGDSEFIIPWNYMRDHLARAASGDLSPSDEIVDDAGMTYRVISVQEQAGRASYYVIARQRGMDQPVAAAPLYAFRAIVPDATSLAADGQPAGATEEEA